jgi:uncharacterized membrane protein YhaH (DUF805 family)
MIGLLKRICNFSGRLGRRHFWLWVLAFWVALFALMLVDAVLHLGGSASSYSSAGQAGFNISGGLLSWIFGILAFIPNLAFAVRRLHDSNRSGWWMVAPLACCGVAWLFSPAANIGGAAGGPVGTAGAFAGFILGVVVLVFLLRDGTEGTNAYGADPRDLNIAEAFD